MALRANRRGGFPRFKGIYAWSRGGQHRGVARAAVGCQDAALPGRWMLRAERLGHLGREPREDVCRVGRA